MTYAVVGLVLIVMSNVVMAMKPFKTFHPPIQIWHVLFTSNS